MWTQIEQVVLLIDDPLVVFVYLLVETWWFGKARSRYLWLVDLLKATTELIWLKQLLSELGFPINILKCLWTDNQAAGHIATNPVFHEGTKHIEIYYHFAREKVLDETICLKHITPKIQVADIYLGFAYSAS